MRELQKLSKTLRKIVEAKKELRELGVATTERHLIGEISEWIVKELYSATRAENKSQPNWDLHLKERKFQVKSHAKGLNNKVRWTEIKYSEAADITHLIIIVFDCDYTIKEFYELEWRDAKQYIQRTNKKQTIKWDDISKYKKELQLLPRQDIINLFL